MEHTGAQEKSEPVHQVPMTSSRILVNNNSLLKAIRFLRRKDQQLASVIKETGVPPLWSRRPGFDTLIRIILEQQVSLQSARSVYRRIRTVTGTVNPDSISGLTVQGLRKLGVTRQKAAYCYGLAKIVEAGTVDLGSLNKRSDQEARAELLSINGVGQWTADIYLLMALRRADVWPTGDLALLVALQKLRGLGNRPTPETAARLSRVWSPWRSVAARVLWQGYLKGILR